MFEREIRKIEKKLDKNISRLYSKKAKTLTYKVKPKKAQEKYLSLKNKEEGT